MRFKGGKGEGGGGVKGRGLIRGGRGFTGRGLKGVLTPRPETTTRRPPSPPGDPLETPWSPPGDLQVRGGGRN